MGRAQAKAPLGRSPRRKREGVIESRRRPGSGAVDRETTRDRLVAAAIDAIAKTGLEGFNVRAVAAAARANVAAVSYHFGSKQALVDVALDATLAQAFDRSIPELDAAIDAAGGNRRAAVESFLVAWFEDAMRSPGIAALHLDGVLRHQDYRGGAIGRAQGFFEELHQRIRPLYGDVDEQEARRSTAQIVATHHLLALAPRLFDRFLTPAPSTQPGLGAFVAHLLAVHGARVDSPPGPTNTTASRRERTRKAVGSGRAPR